MRIQSKGGGKRASCFGRRGVEDLENIIDVYTLRSGQIFQCIHIMYTLIPLGTEEFHGFLNIAGLMEASVYCVIYFNFIRGSPLPL